MAAATSSARPVRLLDTEGAEFILVGARIDPEEAYGLDLDAGRHPNIQRELDMAKSRHPIRPLFEGKWA